MDHLPSIAEPYQPIEIPYLGGERYDGGDFVGYPSRQHWQVSALIEGDLQGHTPIEAAQFLQTWLYFGMIHVALTFDESEPVPWHDFVSVNQSGQSVISTRRLPALLTALIAKLRAAKSRRQHVAYFTQFRKCMELAYSVWNALLYGDSRGSASDLLSPEIMLSIQILGDDLDVGITEVCKTDPLDFRYTWRSSPPSRFLVERMISQGWCPSVVAQLSSPSTTFLYYVSLLGPPLSIDHSKCLAEARSCYAKSVDNVRGYKTKHIVENCDCSHIFIPTGEGSKVASAIGAGDIPVVYVRDDGQNLSVDIKIHSRMNPVAYTAISHVWSDGLGNPSDNSMPSCQMKRLAKLVMALSMDRNPYATTGSTFPVGYKQLDSVAECVFWMDTLCVPVTNMTSRNKAIESMRYVYSAASKVVVLDAELMKSSAEASFEEIYTRIYCSTWIRRLWTLQEAILNRSLLFQFAERALYVGAWSSLADAQKLENKENPWNLVAWECQGTTHRLRFEDLHDSSLNSVAQICLLWYALKNRSTSRVGDEPLCISILHGLDIAEFQRPPHAGTVRKFWSLMVKGVPSFVLFISGPKLTDDGYGWAPASLLDLKIVGTDIRMAEITPRGLLVSYPGFILSHPHNPTRAIIAFSMNGETYFIRQFPRDNSPSWDGLALEKRTNLALILNPVIYYRGARSGVGSSFDAGVGVLVDIVEDGTIKYVKYLRFVTVLRKGSYREQNNNFPWTSIEVEEKLREPIEAHFLPASQEWCVG